MDIEVSSGSGWYTPPPPKPPSAMDLLADFLMQKFPYQSVSSTDYTSWPAQPGDYTGPYFSVGNKVIGYIRDNYTTFVPFSCPNVRDQYKSIRLADPNFFDIFHKMAIYEFGYDPMKPGSREAYFATGFCEYRLFHKDIFEIYWPNHDHNSCK